MRSSTKVMSSTCYPGELGKSYAKNRATGNAMIAGMETICSTVLKLQNCPIRGKCQGHRGCGSVLHTVHADRQCGPTRTVLLSLGAAPIGGFRSTFPYKGLVTAGGSTPEESYADNLRAWTRLKKTRKPRTKAERTKQRYGFLRCCPAGKRQGSGSVGRWSSCQARIAPFAT